MQLHSHHLAFSPVETFSKIPLPSPPPLLSLPLSHQFSQDEEADAEAEIPQLEYYNSKASSTCSSEGLRTPGCSPDRVDANGSKEWNNSIGFDRDSDFFPTDSTSSTNSSAVSSPLLSCFPVVPPTASVESKSASTFTNSSKEVRGARSVGKRPSREEEESSRSRSRWPRLLWSSTIDDPSLVVLRDFSLKNTGNELPVLSRRNGRETGIRDFSRALDSIGL